ncbi:phosphatase 1 regulatory subunit 15B [Pelobates cultripes]|uniref:Phosphatase 1 regulatory subunit 15B, partial n=1 Tax=Pelobates cultripes TaxID=61616 RepID=A0AAD1VKT1_PELCU|nr:phosphatase 1 regulatory subunit 15B [Pelobates cultripes]
MCDRDTSSSPGLRALLGRLLHGLLPYRLLQLLGAALSYLIGPWGDAILSFLSPDCVLSAPGEEAGFQDMMEVLFSPGPGGMVSWVEGKGLETDPLCEFPSQGDNCLQIQYSPENGFCFLHNNRAWEELGPNKSRAWEELGPNKSRAWEELGPNKSRAWEELGPNKSRAWEDLGPNWPQDLLKEYNQVSPTLHVSIGGIILDLNQDLQTAEEIITGLHEKLHKEMAEPCQLAADVPSHTENLGGDQELKLVQQLSIPLDSQEPAGCPLNNDDLSPDQGYSSLEDWKYSDLVCTSNKVQAGMLEVCVPDGDQVACNVLTELQNLSTNENGIIESCQQDSDESDSDLEEDVPVSHPVCNNKYIGYILGTVVSDEESEDLSSCSDEENSADDDGFDSEGSVSDTDSGAEDTEGVELWNSFYTEDPYNPQNFSAVQHTGTSAEEISHVAQEREDVPSDEESWCDSDALSTSDSEDECCVDEEENLKLWNYFNKSDDPYNPLCFKASVHSADVKRHQRDGTSKNTIFISESIQNCKLSTTCSKEELPRFNKKLILPVENSCAIFSKKKVTFHDEVTVFNVCNEEDRKGPWEEYARDRCRFQRRIHETEVAIGHCLTTDHRQRIWDCMRERWDS